MNPNRVSVVLGLLVSLGACVPTARYEEAVKSADEARAATQSSRAEMAEHDQACDANTARLAADLASTRSALDKEGKNAEMEKGSLSAALEQSRARLEELRRAEAAAQMRAALYRDLALKLNRMIGAGEVSIVTRDGRMVLVMPNDVLFDSGRTEIKKSGQKVLEEMAGVLKTVPRHFQVAGHTDNVPISTERFPSNWELSTTRALQVIGFLTTHGVDPTSLSAAGYGEFDPVAANKDEKGRRLNRRIEITLQPNIDELIAIPRQ